MSQIIRITSEALQQTVRRLLPSQQGFGEDLQASNIITPIIDLTPTAEGSQLPTFIQQALAFGSQTAFNSEGGTTTILSTPGFYRMIGVGTVIPSTTDTRRCTIAINDGLGDKQIWRMGISSNANTAAVTEGFDFTLFLRAGDSLKVTTDNFVFCNGSVRQVATVTGELINPVGFSPE